MVTEPYYYGVEQLLGAVTSLVGPGEQRARLTNALLYRIIQITPENDLPEPMRREFDEFMSEIGMGEFSDNAVEQAVAALSDDQVEIFADRILGFYDSIRSYTG